MDQLPGAFHFTVLASAMRSHGDVIVTGLGYSTNSLTVYEVIKYSSATGNPLWTNSVVGVNYSGGGVPETLGDSRQRLAAGWCPARRNAYQRPFPDYKIQQQRRPAVDQSQRQLRQQFRTSRHDREAAKARASQTCRGFLDILSSLLSSANRIMKWDGVRNTQGASSDT